jgi:hypothetical protein
MNETIKRLGNLPIIINQIIEIGGDKRFLTLNVTCSPDEIRLYANSIGVNYCQSHIDSDTLDYGVYRFYPNETLSLHNMEQLTR